MTPKFPVMPKQTVCAGCGKTWTGEVCDRDVPDHWPFTPCFEIDAKFYIPDEGISQS